MADDFIPVISGNVVQVDWWGSDTPTPDWILTFYSDEGAASPMFPPLSQQMHTGIIPVQDPTSGTYMYSAVRDPQDLFINAGTSYWFSPVLFGPPWTWATPVPGPVPDIGLSPDFAHKSFGPPGPGVTGDYAPEPNYAFRVLVEVEETSPVPIPGAIYLLGSGLLGLVGLRKKLKG